MSLVILQELQFDVSIPRKNELRIPITYSQRRKPWPETNNSISSWGYVLSAFPTNTVR